MRSPSSILKGSMKDERIALIYKDFAYWTGYSSTGLEVAATTTVEELRRHGIRAEAIGVRHNIDLFYKLRDSEFTHVVICAPWITPLDLEAILKHFPKIQFAVQSHANVGALHGDYRGAGNFRNYIDLTFSYPNLHVAGNSLRFVEWLDLVYDADGLFLPNLYPAEYREKEIHSGPGLDIGLFGAVRNEKNFVTAVAAALAIQKELDAPVTLHMSEGGDTTSKNVLNTIRQLAEGVPGFDIWRHRWLPWDKFKNLVARMDLLLQPSYSESFNMITADGIAEGVPSVVSHAITWVPRNWKADSDDALDIARRGIALLSDTIRANAEGLQALRRYNRTGIEFWRKFICLR
jgi:glycosyltransferase involved in cell wall biosynthesis